MCLDYYNLKLLPNKTLQKLYLLKDTVIFIQEAVKPKG